jgi:glycosyltransferase involved in cell wall biosynthesis
VWTYALELARVLCDQDIEIALATMGAPLTNAQWREAERIPNLGIFESTYKLEWMHEPWDDVRDAGEWLLELERNLRPDVIHLNNFAHAALPFSAPKLVVAHSDVLSWWRAVKGEDAPESWDQYHDVVRTGLRSADLVVAPSTCALTDVIHHYGPLTRLGSTGDPPVPSGHWPDGMESDDHLRRGRNLFSTPSSIPLGESPSGTGESPVPPPKIVRTEVVPNGREISFRHVAKEPLIFSSGRLWDEAKNICTLASVASELTWPVHVAGDTQEPGGKSVSFANVRLLGPLNAAQMAEQFERASIYCLPVRYEPFGLSALEAALAGCALVLGDIPSQREIWRDAAVFVPPNNADALRGALQQLISDAPRRRELAGRAHERALEFTTLPMASSYLALYSELMEQPRHADVCAS